MAKEKTTTATEKATITPTEAKSPFVFGRKNFTLMFIGIAILLLGFVLMGLPPKEEMFGTMALTVGPIVAFVGFIFQFWAIMAKDSNSAGS